MVIGLIITLVLLYVADFVYRQYKICFNVYNWTNRFYSVQSWVGRNAQIDNDEDSKLGALES